MSTAPGVYRCPKCHLENTGREDVERKHCSFCNLFAEELRGEPVVELQGFEFTRGLTRRDGFSVALWTAKLHGNEDSRVVHGWVRDSFRPGVLIQHAWVETPGVGTYEDESGTSLQRPLTIVVDYCQVDERARFMPKDLYYAEVGVQSKPPPKRYTTPQCVLLGVLYKSDGPWPTEPGE